MAFKYTEEQLQGFDKEQLIKLSIGLQEDMGKLTEKKRALEEVLQKMEKQIAVLSKVQFKQSGRDGRMFRK